MQSQRRNFKGSRGPRRGGRKKGRAGRRNSASPTPFIPTIVYRHRFRYGNGANNGVFTITRANILNQMLLATSAVTTVRLNEAIRLMSVEVWTNPVALGAPPTSCLIEWLGENSPSTVIENTGMGIRPAHVFSAPPPSSSNRWWSMSGSQETDQLFLITLPANSIVEVTCDCRMVETEAPTAGDVPTGASLGQVYGDYLDGIASGKLVPLGYTVLP
jgi:hypothetical protein